RDERAARTKLLDAVVARVTNIDVSRRVNRYSLRSAELSVSRTVATPISDECSGRRELLYSMVLRVRDIHIAGRVHRNAGGAKELPVAGASRTPRLTKAPLESNFCTKSLVRSGSESVT